MLFGLRLTVVALLYLFLFFAFRALRGELRVARSATTEAPRARSTREAARPRPRARIEALPPPVPPAPYPDFDDYDEFDDFGDLAEDASAQYEPLPDPDDGGDDGRGAGPDGDYVEERPPARLPRRTGPRRTGPRTIGRRIPAAVAIPSAAAVLVVVLGTGALLARGEPPGQPSDATPPAAGESTPAPFGPPTRTPAPGRVTVGLAATEDAQLRVTVDGVVEFEGTLRAGQRQAWEAGQRIQVWTDSGRTLLLAVNGQDLGPYSPAMGHPDWNRIDYGFWPGWGQ